MQAGVEIQALFDTLDLFDIAVIVSENNKKLSLNREARKILGLDPHLGDDASENIGFLLLDIETRTPIRFAQKPIARRALLVDITGKEHIVRVGYFLLPPGAEGQMYVFREEALEGAAGCGCRKNYRVEVMGQLCDGIWHDFNNMLGGIMGCAELLTARLEGNEFMSRLVRTILESAGNATSLNRKLLSLSTRSSTSDSSFLLHEALSDAIEILYRGIDRRVELHRDFIPLDLIVSGDYTDFVCLVMLFALAARDSMHKGGQFPSVPLWQRINFNVKGWRRAGSVCA